MNSAVPQRFVGNREKSSVVPSGLMLALAGVFVLWGGNAEAYETVEPSNQGTVLSFGEGGGYEPDPDPEEDPVLRPYFLYVMTPTENDGWKLLDDGVRYYPNGVEWDFSQYDMHVWSWFVDNLEADYFYLVFGAEADWTEHQSGGHSTTSNLFTVGENPTNLTVNAENFPDRDEVGFWGSAGNFTVEDGKTLVFFGEAPLNGSYLGEGKTGTVRDGTLTFGLPYKFSEFKNGMSSGDTGKLVLRDGANVVFQNGVYSASGIDIQPESNVRIVVKDGAEVTVQGDSNVIESVADGDGGDGVIENFGSGALTISGGSKSSAYGIHYNASNGGVGTISNTGSGILTISGGSYRDVYGINANAGNGGVGTISNTGTGTLTITGGSSSYASGIGTNAGRGSVGAILNTSTGSLTISGGSGSYASGITSNGGTISNTGSGGLKITGGSGSFASGIAYNASGTISNEGEGTLTITGGSSSAFGIYFNAHNGGAGTISNTGSGGLTITGGSSAYGIYFNAHNGGAGTISNSGYGEVTITGGSGSSAYGVFYNASEGGSGTISNTGSGTLTISGGSASWASGVHYNAYGSGSTGTISNSGSGEVKITSGCSSSAYGIDTNAYGSGSTGTISNTGSGTLTISGGNAPSSTGMLENASGSGSIGMISNNGTGTLTIAGGNGNYANGIIRNAYRGGSGTITNGPQGTLNILGNTDAGSYGIVSLAFADSTGRLENAGIMNLNKNAIKEFLYSNDGDALVTNKSTGTVNADAEAIFEKTESSSYVDSEIGVLNPEDGKNGNAQVSGFGSSDTTIAWALKEDWANHSVWEDGGTLNITDVMEGSLAAQQIESAFTEQFGTGTELNFLGEDDWASEGGSYSAPAFTSNVGNGLIDQGFAGQIVTNFNLNNAAEDGTTQALTIGTGDGQVIKDSLGFRQIEGVSSLTVNSGKYFALIGLPAGGELIKGGAPVTLDNGMLKLGVTPAESARTDSSTAGTLETVTMRNGSKIETENMWVRVDSVEGDGEISLTETGRMYVGNMNVKGSVKNDGTLSADNLTLSGTLETSKTLKSSGTIAVDSGSKLVADGYVVADKLDVKGVMIRGGKANVFTGAVAMDLLREANAEAAAEVDRVEGKGEVSTLSVLDRIVAASMKKTTTEDTTDDQTETKQEAGQEEASKPPVVVTSKRRAAPVLPQDAQAFAAFDAVNRIASDIDAGGTPDANGLWVKLLTGESEFSVRSAAKFEVDSDGAVIGAEAKISPDLKVGAALSYLDGEIDSGNAKNDWKSYGLTAYAHYKAGDFGVKGSAGWLRGTTEAAEDFDANVWHASVRAEYDLVKAPLTVTPFMGARLMSGSFDGMDSQTVVNVPLGLKLSGELTTAGWTVTPALEASYIRSMGDTEAKDVRFLPENVFAGALSLKAEKGAWTGELSLRGAAGSNDYEDRSFMAKIGLKF